MAGHRTLGYALSRPRWIPGIHVTCARSSGREPETADGQGAAVRVDAWRRQRVGAAGHGGSVGRNASHAAAAQHPEVGEPASDESHADRAAVRGRGPRDGDRGVAGHVQRHGERDVLEGARRIAGGARQLGGERRDRRDRRDEDVQLPNGIAHRDAHRVHLAEGIEDVGVPVKLAAGSSQARR